MSRSKIRWTLSLPLLVAFSLATAPAVATGWNDGVAAFQAGDWSRAESAFRAQTDSTPDHAASWFMLAQAQYRQEALDDAAASFHRAVELAPDEPSYALGWGRTELERGRAEAAVAILARHSPASVPDRIRRPYFQLLAAAVRRAERPEQAVGALERAVDEDPETAVLWTALGRAREAAGRLDDAWQAHQKAANISGSVEDLRRLVDFALRQKWYERAAEEAAKVAEESGAAEDFLRLGEAHLEAGQCENALPAFERAGELAPEDPYPAYYRGHCHLVLKDGESALAALNGALGLEPSPALGEKILVARGQALHLLKRYGDAARAYRLAGDDERAARMEKFAETAKDNEAWERAKRDCLDRLSKVVDLLEDSADLQGTPEYQRLEEDLRRLRRECSAYR